MRLVWTIKVYNTGGMKKPYRIKIEGNPSMRSDVPWTFTDGEGHTPEVALKDAMESMSQSDQATFRLLFNPST